MRFRSHLLQSLAVVLFCVAPAAADPPTLIDTWGTFGSGPGQFAYPGGVAVQGSDFVYVADQGNDRIQKFTSSGSFVTQWGTGDETHPARIHLANGRVYVVEHQAHRVSMFTYAGAFLGSFGQAGQQPGDLSHPVGITSDAGGNIYVAEATAHRVQKFTANGVHILSMGGLGSNPGQMRQPYGVMIGPDNLVYVSEYTGSRVQKFTQDGTFVGGFGGPGTGDGQFNAAQGMAFDGAGRIFVCDTGNDRVQIFQQDGTYIDQFPIPYGTEAELRPIPCELGFDPSGVLYVVAFGSARVHKYAFGNRAPDCSGARASTPTIWPPNHQLVPVSIVGVVDPDGSPVQIRVTSITQDEPLTDGPHGHQEDPVQDPRRPDIRDTEDEGGAGDPQNYSPSDAPAGNGNGNPHDCPDATIDAQGNAQVRMERLTYPEGGNGRVYRISYEASDGTEVCRGVVQVCVPLKRNGTCADDGLLVNSLGECPSDIVEDPSGDAAIRGVEQLGTNLAIEYRLPAAGEVEMRVFDVAGRRVATIERGVRPGGVHRVTWNASGVGRGVYFCRLQTGAITRTRTLIVR